LRTHPASLSRRSRRRSFSCWRGGAVHRAVVLLQGAGAGDPQVTPGDEPPLVLDPVLRGDRRVDHLVEPSQRGLPGRLRPRIGPRQGRAECDCPASAFPGALLDRPARDPRPQRTVDDHVQIECTEVEGTREQDVGRRCDPQTVDQQRRTRGIGAEESDSRSAHAPAHRNLDEHRHGLRQSREPPTENRCSGDMGEGGIGRQRHLPGGEAPGQVECGRIGIRPDVSAPGHPVPVAPAHLPSSDLHAARVGRVSVARRRHRPIWGRATLLPVLGTNRGPQLGSCRTSEGRRLREVTSCPARAVSRR